jgi:hypothetical protein
MTRQRTKAAINLWMEGCFWRGKGCSRLGWALCRLAARGLSAGRSTVGSSGDFAVEIEEAVEETVGMASSTPVYDEVVGEER